jgi:Poly(hydroxyalcanoate) granule associated protein (phasin)
MTSPARKPAARKAAAKLSAAPAPKATPAQPATPASAAQRSGNPALRAAAQIVAAQKMLLQAGLRVLRVDREPATPDLPPPASMEEVFDRRVASALQRLGMPDAADLARLAERLEAMDRRLEAIQRKSRRKAAA